MQIEHPQLMQIIESCREPGWTLRVLLDLDRRQEVMRLKCPVDDLRSTLVRGGLKPGVYRLQLVDPKGFSKYAVTVEVAE